MYYNGHILQCRATAFQFNIKDYFKVSPAMDDLKNYRFYDITAFEFTWKNVEAVTF